MTTGAALTPVGLEWVRRDGVLVRASDLANLAPADRPAVECPVCREGVVLKLGKVRRHHAAHRAESRCPALNPETALHINVKLHLADELTRAIGVNVPLRIQRPCVVGRSRYVTGGDLTWTESVAPGCTASLEETWVEGWDEVAVESSVRSDQTRRVPDILLRRDGTAIAAIEIVVSNSVDSAKAEFLSRINVPWIEIRGSDEIHQGATRWRVERPLEVSAASFPVAWRCREHDAAHQVEREQHSRIAERAATWPAARRVQALRVVDVYHPSGGRTRLVYSVVASHPDAQVATPGVSATTTTVEERTPPVARPTVMVLQRDSSVVGVYHPESDESLAAFRSRISPLIRNAYNKDLRRIRRRAALIDSPMVWLRDPEVATVTDEYLRFPPRYRFDPARRQWMAIPELVDAGWPLVSSLQRTAASIEGSVVGRRRGAHRALRPRNEPDR